VADAERERHRRDSASVHRLLVTAMDLSIQHSDGGEGNTAARASAWGVPATPAATGCNAWT